MKQIAIDICVYCCGKATSMIVIDNEYGVGICDEHKNISEEKIKDIIGDVKLKENRFNYKA